MPLHTNKCTKNVLQTPSKGQSTSVTFSTLYVCISYCESYRLWNILFLTSGNYWPSTSAQPSFIRVKWWQLCECIHPDIPLFFVIFLDSYTQQGWGKPRLCKKKSNQSNKKKKLNQYAACFKKKSRDGLSLFTTLIPYKSGDLLNSK